MKVVVVRDIFLVILVSLGPFLNSRLVYLQHAGSLLM